MLPLWLLYGSEWDGRRVEEHKYKVPFTDNRLNWRTNSHWRSQALQSNWSSRLHKADRAGFMTRGPFKNGLKIKHVWSCAAVENSEFAAIHCKNPEPFQHPLDRQHSTFSHWRRQTSSTSLSQGLTQEISPAWSNNSLQHLACVQKITLWTLGFKLSVWADLQPGLFHHVIHSKFTASISCIFVPSHLTSTPLITFNTYWLSFSVSVNPYQS